MSAFLALPQLDSFLDEVQPTAVIASRQAIGDMLVTATATLDLQSIHQATHSLTSHGYHIVNFENGGCDFICSNHHLSD